MRHRNVGKQLSRSTSHRKALRRNMAASLIEHGAIRTTTVKAKELRGFVERLITIAKNNTLHARRQVVSMLNDREIWSWSDAEKDYEQADKSVVQKLFSEIAPRYAARNGGYTRIIRLAERRIGDAGKQVLLQLVEETKPTPEGTASAGGRRRRQRAKRQADVQAFQAAAPAAAAEPAAKEPAAAAPEAAQDSAAQSGEPAKE